MCIISKTGVETKTVIYVSANKLLYINSFTDHDAEADDKKTIPPCMCFSFNGKVKTSSAIKVDDLGDFIKLYKKTEIILSLPEDEDECDNIIGYSGSITYSNGYKIYVGETLNVFKVAIKDYPDVESVKLLSTLIDPTMMHGKYSVYAVPQSSYNDWTGINLEFEEPIKKEDIIIPTCHEYSKTGRYIYDQLIIADNLLFNDTRYETNDISPNKYSTVLGRRNLNSFAIFDSIPAPSGFMCSCYRAYINKHSKELDKPHIIYKLVINSPVNSNIKLTDLITVN